MSDDKILNTINALKQYIRNLESNSNINNRELSGRLFKMANPQASDQEVVEYATNPDNRLPEIDPTGMMGSTRTDRDWETTR